MKGDFVPFHGPAAREYARSTSGRRLHLLSKHESTCRSNGIVEELKKGDWETQSPFVFGSLLRLNLRTELLRRLR